MSNTTFLQAVEQSWSKIGDAYQCKLRRRDDHSKVVLEVVTPEYLASIEAWESASCLDITVMDIHTRALSILSAGLCATRDEICVCFKQVVDLLARGKNDT